MKSVKKFMKENIKSIESLINSSKLKPIFSSHDFIENFCSSFETDYIEMLNEYKGSGNALQTVHGQIARLLSTNQDKLNIKKVDKRYSRNFHGTKDKIQWWKKVCSDSII